MADEKIQLYSVEEKEPNSLYIVYNAMGDLVMTLTGGYSTVLLLQWYNLHKQDTRRGDDFMAGVLAGCMHMNMLPPNSTPPPLPSAN